MERIGPVSDQKRAESTLSKDVDLASASIWIEGCVVRPREIILRRDRSELMEIERPCKCGRELQGRCADQRIARIVDGDANSLAGGNPRLGVRKLDVVRHEPAREESDLEPLNLFRDKALQGLDVQLEFRAVVAGLVGVSDRAEYARRTFRSQSKDLIVFVVVEK